MSTLIGEKVHVGSDGWVILKDVMGDDHRVVDAARISYGRHEEREDERDRGLIRYLMRHRHTSPFEQCELTFIVRCPMDVWRQWIRHRTASVNEYSTRYTEAIDSMAITAPEAWRRQTTKNKQGSAGTLGREEGKILSNQEWDLHTQARNVYHDRLAAGVAREQARKDLPLSTYTEAYWKIDLHNLLHFLELRMDSHAQLEIRTFAAVIYTNFVKPLFPFVSEAFEDYRLDAVTFTGPERRYLARMADFKEALKHVDDLPTGLSGREKSELKAKLIRFDLS